MKTILNSILASSVLIVSPSGAENNTVTVTPVPEHQNSTYYYVTGNLTNAVSQLGSGQYGVGYFWGDWTTAVGPTSITQVNCCTGNNTDGKVWSVQAVAFHVSSIEHRMYVPAWIGRACCDNAETEWQRFETSVWNHEHTHYDHYKAYLDKTSNYSGQVAQKVFQTACSAQTPSEAQEELDTKISAAMDAMNAKMSTDIAAKSNDFHEEQGPPNLIYAIDLSNECVGK